MKIYRICQPGSESMDGQLWIHRKYWNYIHGLIDECDLVLEDDYGHLEEDEVRSRTANGDWDRELLYAYCI